MDSMLAEYYKLRGWDDRGRPRDEKLQALSLDKNQRFDCKPRLFSEKDPTVRI